MILITSLFVFFTLISASNLQLQTSNSLTTESESWENYQPIADQDLNWSYLKMVLDSDENLHLFWSARSRIENYTQIYHEVHFTNGSIKRNVVLTQQNNTNYFEFDVDIDTLNRIHLVYYNQTSRLIVYQIFSNNSWNVIDEIDENFFEFVIAIDSFDIVHVIIAKYDGNLYDRVYEADNYTVEKQMTFYSITEDEFIVIFKIQKAKSKEGKIALLYNFEINSELPGDMNNDEIHCIIYDTYWMGYHLVYDYMTYAYDLAFDDTEKLHLMWADLEAANAIKYQTVKGSKWSDVEQIILFEQAAETQYGLFDVGFEIQGKTRLIAYTSSKILEVGFDINLYITQSNDGKTWTSQPVYTDNNSRSYIPKIVSSTNGDVYITTMEEFWDESHYYTFYFGSYEEFFTYETTKASIENILFLLPLTLSIIVANIKTRKKKA